MNISDSQRIAAVLEKIGYEPADMDKADLVLVNMCSVRQSAVDRIWGLDRKIQDFKKQNKKMTAVLTGCVLEKDRKSFAEFFDYILSSEEITKLPEYLARQINFSSKRGNELFEGPGPLVQQDKGGNLQPEKSLLPSANVPIMTGCNNFCAYCVVPYTRGREISRPAEEIICEVKKSVALGAKEIWLLGQNVNSYKDGKKTFPALLKEVSQIPGNFWVRFTSSHPKDFSDELVDIMSLGGKITPYLNLPVQAGHDKILKKMNRPYTVSQYKNLVKKVREKIPNICISTDIIVGFPGETKKQFENSKKLFEAIKFDMAYISEYSPRPGTASSKMEDNVPHKEKMRRKFELNEILKRTAIENNLKYIGQNVEALITGQKKKTAWVGKTKEYKTIYIESPKKLMGKFIKAKIVNATSWGLSGKLL